MAARALKAGDFIVALTNAPASAAQNLAAQIIARRLAACVSVMPGGVSHYRWKRRVHRDKESLLIIKTKKNNFSALKDFISEKHPYKLPELIALKLSSGSAPYLKWLEQNAS